MTDNGLRDRAFWRSPHLGEERRLSVAGGEIGCFVRGDGPSLVFAHGWGVNANLWRGVADKLAPAFRCHALDLPFGAHRRAMGPDADLTPAGCGRLIVEALEVLDLKDVVLAGNDSGGAYSQIALATDASRVAGLALIGCETPYDTFPPAQFQSLPLAAKDAAVLAAGYEALKSPEARAAPTAYGLLAKRPIDPRTSDSFALPPSVDRDILRDVAKVMSSADTAAVHQAGEALIRDFDKPVLFAWSRDDPVFPLAHAERYASALKRARVKTVGDSYSFISEDQPQWLSATLATFARLTLGAEV